MSRVSLYKRMLEIEASVLRLYPFLKAINSLNPADRLRYDGWRTQCDEIIAEAESEDGPGGAYKRLINGELWLPELRQDVASKIFPDSVTVPNDASLADVADMYKDMLND